MLTATDSRICLHTSFQVTLRRSAQAVSLCLFDHHGCLKPCTARAGRTTRPNGGSSIGGDLGLRCFAEIIDEVSVRSATFCAGEWELSLWPRNDWRR